MRPPHMCDSEDRDRGSTNIPRRKLKSLVSIRNCMGQKRVIETPNDILLSF